MAHFSNLFFLALLGLTAFGSSIATPYIPRQGSDHVQMVDPNQQKEEIIFAAPLELHPAAPSSPAPSSELQQAPPRVNTEDVEPMDQAVDSTEILVQTLTEDERTNLVSLLICEMCRELNVSMCIRMCNGKGSGNGTQIEAAGGNSTGSNGQATEEEDVVATLGDSEDGEAGNSTASAANGNSTDGSFDGGNATESNAEGGSDPVFNLGGDASTEESGNNNTVVSNGNESGNSTSTAEDQGSSNSTMTGEEEHGRNGTDSNAQGEDGSLFNVLGDEEASGQSGNATLSGGSDNLSSEVQGGNSTQEATGGEAESTN